MWIAMGFVTITVVSLAISKLFGLQGTTIGRIVYVCIAGLVGGLVCIGIEMLLTGVPTPPAEDPGNRIWIATFMLQGFVVGLVSGVITCKLL